MSKRLRLFPPIFAAFVISLQIFTNARAQDIDVRLKITVESHVSADIRGNFALNNQRKIPRNLWFLDEYAGISGLTNRLSIVYIYDNQGYLIARKRFTAAERVSSIEIGGFGYSVGLTPFANASAAAHVSWVNGDGGLLLLDDLLPQSVGKTANVKIEMPAGWKVFTTESESGPNVFDVSDVEKAVFYIGSHIREQQVRAGNSPLKLLISGEWLFSDKDAAAMVESIFGEYDRLFGRLPRSALRVWISKFPIPVGVGNWEADSRGGSVTIVSSDMPFKAQSLQRLHEQLRHEIFHLWIPNGVNLSGNYDWFYEGFALYQSLKTGVAVNRIRFDDFLDTLSRAYEIDSMQAKKLSLIDASKNRWNGSNTQIYARGMLVAFLCDLALLEKSKGKISVSSLLREIFERHRPPNPSRDGNSAIIAILREHRELNAIVDSYILGAEPIEWMALIKSAGIEADINHQLTKLKVTAKPTGRQKDLLDKLGYNNWRKLSGSNR